MLFAHIHAPLSASEQVRSVDALGRVTAEEVLAPHPLPEFPRSTMDGYAVSAADTYGASESLPAYLALKGEVQMGQAPGFTVARGECALIHTGGMMPPGTDAVVMLEFTQYVERGGTHSTDIEILKPAAEGENTIRIGEDAAAGSVLIPKGQMLRPAELGGLAAVGILDLRVVTKPRIGLISSGDEVVEAAAQPLPGQVRDVNSQTLAALITLSGGEPVNYGIFPDDRPALEAAARRALAECDAVILTAGSSASSRDMTAAVIDSLGEPGVLVHGIHTRPGKPTILGACSRKAVIGLPGNPVSALVNGYLFVVPLIGKLLGCSTKPKAVVRAAVNGQSPFTSRAGGLVAGPAAFARSRHASG